MNQNERLYSLNIVNRRRGTALETVLIQFRLGQKKCTGHVTKVGAYICNANMAASTTSFNDEQENWKNPLNEVERDLLESVVELLDDDSNVAKENDIDIEEVRHGS